MKGFPAFGNLPDLTSHPSLSIVERISVLGRGITHVGGLSPFIIMGLRRHVMLCFWDDLCVRFPLEQCHDGVLSCSIYILYCLNSFER